MEWYYINKFSLTLNYFYRIRTNVYLSFTDTTYDYPHFHSSQLLESKLIWTWPGTAPGIHFLKLTCSYFLPPCNGRPPTTGYTLTDVHWCWNYTRVPFKASASSISQIKTTLVRDPFFEQLLIPALDNAIKPPHRPPVQSGVMVITPGDVNWRQPFSMCNQIATFRKFSDKVGSEDYI